MDSQRIYQGKDNQWYFDVRGNQAKGPYTTYRDADAALTHHVRQCRRRLDGSLWPRLWSPFKQRRNQASTPKHS